MIIATLDTISPYVSLNSRFSIAFDFLRSTDLTVLEVGAHPIAGGDVYALVNEYQTKDPSEGTLEGHRKYIDVQVVVSGREQFGYAPFKDQRVIQEYNAEKDIAFFAGPASFVLLEHHMVAICFPDDLHMPGIAAGVSQPVKKIVIKVRID